MQHVWEEARCIHGFGREPEGMRPLGRQRHKWEGNTKMDLQEVGWRSWNGYLAQGRNKRWPLLNVVMNLRVPENERNFFTS
jgi:hypothetical protein